MREFLNTLWSRVSEPRIVSMLRWVMYMALLLGGITAIVDPPRSLTGEIGTYAMVSLATLLAFGGLIGAVAVLPGAWWLERIALLAIILALLIYGGVIIGLQFTQPGNRLLQLSMVLGLTMSQFVRWARISARPYDPELRNADETTAL